MAGLVPAISLRKARPCLPKQDARVEPTHHGALLRVVLQTRIEQVVLPLAVDAEVLARVALALEAGLLQQPDRGLVGRDARGLEAVQPQIAERERDERAHRGRHEALPRKWPADPIADRARLRDAA